MTVDEARRLLSAIRVTWPHSRVGGDDMAAAVTTWQWMLRDVPYPAAVRAVERLVHEGRSHAPALPELVVEIDRAEALDGVTRRRRHVERWCARNVPDVVTGFAVVAYQAIEASGATPTPDGVRDRVFARYATMVAAT